MSTRNNPVIAGACSVCGSGHTVIADACSVCGSGHIHLQYHSTVGNWIPSQCLECEKNGKWGKYGLTHDPKTVLDSMEYVSSDGESDE